MKRREFLKTSSAVLAGASTLALSRSAHAQGSGTIKVGLVGCGNRGLGAANQALGTGEDVKLVAIGDYFKSRAKNGLEHLRNAKPEQVDVPEDNIFDGFQNDVGVINSGVDVVLIACTAKFHPLYTKRALDAGKHVFCEKPNAIDAAGIAMLEETVATAKEKNLCYLSGLHSRYSPQFQATVEKVRDGIIGDVRMIQSTFLRYPYGIRRYPPLPDLSDVDTQVHNQYMFSWLGGDDFTQSLVHNVDRMSWLLGGLMPEKAFGMGGRAAMSDPEYGNVFDHHAATFLYPDDRCRLFAFCRTIKGCFDSYDDLIYGTKGTVYWTESNIVGETNWKYNGKRGYGHWEEQAALFNAIRKGERLHSDDYIVKSTTMAVLGQIAAYTGKMIGWQEMVDSMFCFKPAPEDCVAGMAPPVVPGPDGSYPVPIPGKDTWW